MSAPSPLPRPSRNYTLPVLALAAGLALGVAGTRSSHRTTHRFAPPCADSKVLEQKRDALEIVAKLRKDPYWKQVNVAPNAAVNPKMQNQLTQHTLKGEGMFAIAPLLFVNEENNHAKAVIHVGEKLCGHTGIIHGGLLATLLDEITGRTTIPHLPNKMGFTVNLNINYRKVVHSNQFLLLESKLEELKGRKAIGHGWIKDVQEDKVHADAIGIFVSPKYGILAKMATWF